jgi:hypothetical protein
MYRGACKKICPGFGIILPCDFGAGVNSISLCLLSGVDLTAGEGAGTTQNTITTCTCSIQRQSPCGRRRVVGYITLL